MAHYVEATKMNEAQSAILRGAGSSGIAPSAPPTDLASVHARLNEACSIVAGLNDRQRRVGDAVYGSRPEKDGSEATAARVPCGALEEINETVDRLFVLLHEGDRLVGRMSTLA